MPRASRFLLFTALCCLSMPSSEATQLFGGAEHSDYMAPPPAISPPPMIPSDPAMAPQGATYRPWSMPPTPSRSNTVAPPPLQGETRDQVYLRSRQAPLYEDQAVTDQIRHRTIIPVNAEKSDLTRYQTQRTIIGGAQSNAFQQRPINQQAIQQVNQPAHSQVRAHLDVPVVEWFMLPKWMAGSWTKKGDLTVSVTNLRTGKTDPANQWIDNVMTYSLGHQTDRNGNIWQADFIPSERDGESDGKGVKFLTTAMRCEKTDPMSVVTRTHYLVSEINESTGQITDTFQQESLNSYTLQPDGELVNNSSNRVFSYTGQPIKGGQLVSRFTKVAPYVPVARARNIDLAQSLRQYLSTHGMENLVP